MPNMVDDDWPEGLVSPEPALHAALYAALHQGSPGDIQFYSRMCAGAERVIEFGAGSGRIALALAEAGVLVLGIDCDEPLLSLALQRQAAREHELGRELTVRFERADMSCFRSPAAFDRVLIPYSGFWCLAGIEKKRACLQAAAECLRDDGVLYLDAYDADALSEDEARNDEGPVIDDFELAHEIEHEGAQVSVLERNVWWPRRRELRADYQLVPRETGRPGWRMSVAHHYLLRHELAELLDSCGFEVQWGPDLDAEGTPFAEQLIVVAVKG